MSIGNKIHLSTFVILIVLILGAQLVLVNNLLAQDLTKLYVDAAADTAAADGTEAHPYPGIDLACLAASSGDTILVLPGTYGNANIAAPRPDSLTIMSLEGAQNTIIDGSKTADASFGIVIRAGSGWTVDGFTFINIGGVVSSG
ncbi:MAG: hypothetical protein P8184_01895, partial [Calditrichia bacterium]